MAASSPISPSIPIMPGTSPRLLEYQIEALDRMTSQHELATAPATLRALIRAWFSAQRYRRGAHRRDARVFRASSFPWKSVGEPTATLSDFRAFA